LKIFSSGRKLFGHHTQVNIEGIDLYSFGAKSREVCAGLEIISVTLFKA
jgi:hypothetical protein